MKSLAQHLRRDEAGSFGVEFAIALPVLIALMIGILNFGLVFNANGSMRNAMGEGLRYAKVERTASDADVISVTRQSLVGVAPNAVQTLTFNRATVNNTETGTMTMTIVIQPIIPFAPLPPIRLTQTKSIYLPT